MVKKVYGIRICRNCKGICHKGSYRSKLGQRKIYFCSKKCLEQYLEKWITRKGKLHLLSPSARKKILSSLIKEFMKDYERVDVITR